MKQTGNSGKGKTNRLVDENSPYLLQHAHNPVDWYPWGDEAFRKAGRENKPVLLSIGYSACHWCHVMAHESFENDRIASLMNQFFVNIKVDREEYPDVDHLYQAFLQMTTGRGGWPLTVFLTPDKIPFYGGTYFPATERHGMISFPELLKRVYDVYRHQPDKVSQNAVDINQALQSLQQPQMTGDLPQVRHSFGQLFRSLQNNFDYTEGGFGSAPKFPRVSDLRFLLNYYHYSGENQAKEMSLFTLKKMANGGIYDQLGGGFHRYATDGKWLVPHFEKMLYDNALLIPLYVDAFRLTGEDFYKQVAVQTTEFVLREVTDQSGGFHATLDADSEGEEGKYYVWSYAEIVSFLDDDIRDIFCEYYNITPSGNFEGKNILHVTRSLSSLVDHRHQNPELVGEKIEKARQKLLEERNRRIHPGLDHKILTDWNGMMITALWKVYEITGTEKYRRAAEKAIQFISKNLSDRQGKLHHMSKNRKEETFGYIDDYAFYIQGLIEGFETTQHLHYLNKAGKLCEYTLKNFWDNQFGGFFFSDISAKTTVVRLRQHYDASTPAGNHVMCQNLLRLWSYTGKQQYLTKAEQIFKVLKNEIENRANGLSSIFAALLSYYYSPVEMTVSGVNQDDSDTIFKNIHHLFIPNRVLVHIHPKKDLEGLNGDLIQGRKVKNKTAVFICFKGTCSLPIEKPEEISRALNDFGVFIR